MYGLEILLRTLEVPTPPRSDPDGTRWQYHPRRGHHSKVSCWGVLLDLLETSAVLRSQFQSDEIVFGLDLELRDYTRDQPKKLDLVIGRPDPDGRWRDPPHSLPGLVDEWSIHLTDEERVRVSEYGYVTEGPIGPVHLAVEAKAAMTEFGKARPRLYDELNSSHQIVHGASNHALAVGLAMINICETFVSPLRNPGHSFDTAVSVTKHKQPTQAKKTVDHVKGLPRRSGASSTGYDALAIVVIDLPNDGRPISLVSGDPAPDPTSVFHYDHAIRRAAAEYEARFARI